MGITSNQNHKLFSSELLSFCCLQLCGCHTVPMSFLFYILSFPSYIFKFVCTKLLFKSSSNKLKLSVVFLLDFMVYCRMVKMPEEETDTNPIDRTVAHLLFHRPVDFAGKHPESPVSTKIPCEHKTVGIANCQWEACLPLQKVNRTFLNRVLNFLVS